MPVTFELASEESQIVVVDGVSTTSGDVEEDFYCYAVIEGVRDKSIILSFVITASFVDPTVEMSKVAMQFRKDQGPDVSVTSLIGKLLDKSKDIRKTRLF